MGQGCANADFAGVYARLGGPLNDWVMQRHPWSTFSVGAAHSGTQTALTATAFHPMRRSTGFTWDFDNDGQYDDAGGASISRVFTTGGAVPVGVRASQPDRGQRRLPADRDRERDPDDPSRRAERLLRSARGQVSSSPEAARIPRARHSPTPGT